MDKDFDKKADIIASDDDIVYGNVLHFANDFINVDIENMEKDIDRDIFSTKQTPMESISIQSDSESPNSVVMQDNASKNVRVKNLIELDTERKLNKFDLFFIKFWAFIVTAINSISEGINCVILKIFKKKAPIRYINAIISTVLIVLLALLFTIPFRINVEKEEALSIFAKNLIPVQVVVGYNSDNQPTYRWGYASKKNVGSEPASKALIIEAKYEEALPFHADGVAWVKSRNDKGQYYWELINTKGKLVSKNNLTFEVTNDMPFGVRPVGTFNDSGLCWVIKAGKFGYINKKGKIIINCSYDFASDFSDGYARVARGSGANRQEWFINTKEKLIGRSYDKVMPFSSGMGAIYRNGVWGFINTKGTEVITPKYNAVSQFVGDYAMVKMSKTFGLIDKKGNSIIADIEYSDVYINNDIFRKFVEEHK